MACNRLHLLLVGDVIESAGTRSYLREMVMHLRQSGLEVCTHCFQFRLSARETSGYNQIQDFNEPVFIAPGRCIFAWLPRPLYRLFERLVLMLFLRREMRKMKPEDVLIASGCLGALYLITRRLPDNTWWMKLGLIEEEGTGTLRFHVRKHIESMHARMFHNRIVVSSPMGEFINNEYGKQKGEQQVLPCLVDLEHFPSMVRRGALRRQLGLEKRFIVTYVGTAASWQCAPETVAFFALLRKRMPNAFLWIFTPDREIFELLLSDVPKDCWKVEFRPHHELASVLPAADIGCLIRHRECINRVASPLKFLEYLSCGLPVLIGPEVGDYSRLVCERGLGTVIDPNKPESWPQVIDTVIAMADDADICRQCRMEAEALSWQTFSPRLAKVFDGKTEVGRSAE